MTPDSNFPFDIPKNYQFCTKCYHERTPLTDTDESILQYKTCNKCRTNNHMYRKNLKRRRKEERLLDPEKKYFESFDQFLSCVAQNNEETDEEDVVYDDMVPVWLLRRYSVQELDDSEKMFVGTKSLTGRELIKSRLVVHYLARITDVISNFKFSIRTSNWSDTKFSVLLYCSQDYDKSGGLCAGHTPWTVSKIPSFIINGRLMYECKSKLSLVYDGSNGNLRISFNHLHHEPRSAKVQSDSQAEGLHRRQTEDMAGHISELPQFYNFDYQQALSLSSLYNNGRLLLGGSTDMGQEEMHGTITDY